MGVKKCTNCNESKSILEFRKSSKSKDGLKPTCKKCMSIKDAVYRNRPENKQKAKEFRINYDREKWYKNHYYVNKDYILSKNKSWRDNNKHKIDDYEASRKGKRVRNNKSNTNYVKAKRGSDIEYRLRNLLSNNLRSALNKVGVRKRNNSILKYIGCTIAELKVHLEKLFCAGMNWGNYGEWHIDHKIPLKLFKLERESCRYVAYNYSNLQPLWGVDNIKKGGRYVRPY